MSNVTNKKDLGELVSSELGLTKTAGAEAVEVIFNSIKETLAKGGKVDVAGFGKFEVKERAARTGINPQTKEKIKIAASKAPGFKASKTLKDVVNN